MRRLPFARVLLVLLFALGIPITGPVIHQAEAAETVELSFADKNLYTRLCQELGSKVTGKDDNARVIRMDSDALGQITKLDLRNGQIANIEGIGQFTALTELDLSQNMLGNVSALAPLVNLKTLNLYDNVITDLAGLEALTDLETLKLGENNERRKGDISHLDALGSLRNLTYLDFSENYCPDIVGTISGLTALEYLNLEQNRIEDISGLDGLTGLKTLNLYLNRISDITPLYNLTRLEDVVLYSNSVYNIVGMEDNGTLIWPNLKRLALARNSFNSASAKALALLREKSKAGEIEFNFEDIVDTSSLPHEDADGTKYVTYEDFGARCDGSYDDFIAIRNAHIFANDSRNGCEEVRATQGKTYHIYKPYEDSVAIKTNVNWNGASFVIHDEHIDECSGRYKNIFTVEHAPGSATLTDPGFTVDTQTKSISGFESLLNANGIGGYDTYLCVAKNDKKKQYIRFGMNANSGDSQQDSFIVDAEGNVLNPIQWDFSQLTSLAIYPIPHDSIEIKNGSFTTNALAGGEREAPYTRGSTGKSIYYNRNIYLKQAANVSMSGIHHTSSEDRLSGSYFGFLYARGCVNLSIADGSLYSRKYSANGRSTYDLVIDDSVNVTCRNITSNDILDVDRWGIVQTAYSRDVTFEGCELNRVDAHQGIYNLTVSNCNIGSSGLTVTGQGELNVTDTTVTANAFITLREDYGSTWNGQANIVNCTYRYMGSYAPKLFNFKFYYDDSPKNTRLHDFGYDCRFPNVDIVNLLIDFADAPDYDCVYIIPNFDSQIGNPYNGNLDYWPHTVNVSGYSFVNNAKDATLRLSVQEIDKRDGVEHDYSLSDKLPSSEGDENGEDEGPGQTPGSDDNGQDEEPGQTPGSGDNEQGGGPTQTPGSGDNGQAGDPSQTPGSGDGQQGGQQGDAGQNPAPGANTDGNAGGSGSGPVEDLATQQPPDAVGSSGGSGSGSVGATSAGQSTSVKAVQSITRVSTSKTLKHKTLKKKAQAFKITAKAKDGAKLSYKVAKYLKTGKITVAKVRKCVKVSSAGKVTVKKGAPKGTYKLKVKISVKATAKYRAKTVTKTITIKVK